jgi:hypothetical protein
VQGANLEKQRARSESKMKIGVLSSWRRPRLSRIAEWRVTEMISAVTHVAVDEPFLLLGEKRRARN